MTESPVTASGETVSLCYLFNDTKQVLCGFLCMCVRQKDAMVLLQSESLARHVQLDPCNAGRAVHTTLQLNGNIWHFKNAFEPTAPNLLMQWFPNKTTATCSCFGQIFKIRSCAILQDITLRLRSAVTTNFSSVFVKLSYFLCCFLSV